jgi:hypothetical protein
MIDPSELLDLGRDPEADDEEQEEEDRTFHPGRNGDYGEF